MLEIVVSSSEEYLLKNCNLFNKEDVMGFCILSSYGDLKDLDKKKTKLVGDNIFDIVGDFNTLNEKLKYHRSVRIWYTSVNSEYISNMYYLVNYLKDKDVNIYICDTFKDYEEYISLNCYGFTEIEELLKKSRILSKKEIEEISSKWQKLSEENSDIRVLEGSDLKSYSYDYIDNMILDLLSNIGSVYIYKLIGLCMKNRICSFDMDCIYLDRINYLISINKIKVDKIVKEKVKFMGYVDKKYISICKEKEELFN